MVQSLLADVIADGSPPERDTDRQLEILENVFPILCNDAAMLVRRPFRMNFDPTIDTASTDCLAEINIAPWFFLEGERETGFGSLYHECGHILRSPFGVELLKEADRRGGPVLKSVLNIILDRKDDTLMYDEAPGFADRMRLRLPVICTLSRKEEYAKLTEGMSRAERLRFLARLRPKDAYEEFFLAAKWNRRPRSRAVFRAMKHLSRRNLLAASPGRLLDIAEKVVEILGTPPTREEQDRKERFVQLVQLVLGTEHGKRPPLPSKKLLARIKRMLKLYVDANRHDNLRQLENKLKGMGLVHPGPISTGKTPNIPVKKMDAQPGDAGLYAGYAAEVQGHIEDLRRKLKVLDNPSEFTLYGQDDGDIDFSEVGRIACGLPGFRMETVEERNIDAEIHLAIDCSGSMSGEKLEDAKRIAVAFDQAMEGQSALLDGHLWAYNSHAVYDLGPAGSAQSLVRLQGTGGNSDTAMLVHVGQALAKSKRRRRVLLVLCDDGPDDMEEARRLSQLLLARGTLCVHLLVGVHGTPHIFPIELLYDSMRSCLEEFGKLLESIIKNLR